MSIISRSFTVGCARPGLAWGASNNDICVRNGFNISNILLSDYAARVIHTQHRAAPSVNFHVVRYVKASLSEGDTEAIYRAGK
jgi:hypothetical protein